MADGSQLAAMLGAAGGLAGLGGLVRAVTTERHTVNRSEIEVLETRSAGYRRELDEVRGRLDEYRDRLNECRQRELGQEAEMGRMRYQIELLQKATGA